MEENKMKNHERASKNNFFQIRNLKAKHFSIGIRVNKCAKFNRRYVQLILNDQKSI